MTSAASPAPAFPVVHSVLSPAALTHYLRKHYACVDVQVEFLRRGINDTYRVRGLTGHPQAILRVYRAGWRTPADLNWELSLTAQSPHTARPVARLDGLLHAELPAPEGARPVAVFEFVTGRMPQRDAQDAALYGRTLAHLHQFSMHFPAGGRFHLDAAHLMSAPLDSMRPLLQDDLPTLHALEEFAAHTDARLSPLAPDLPTGACHGDPHDANARIDESGTLRLFDFDCGGHGWLAHDVAVYWWDHALNDTPEELAAVWPAFLDAYQLVRPLCTAEQQALPLLVLARSLWFMGLYAGRVSVNGRESLRPDFFRRGAAFMQDWAAKHP